MHKGRSCQKFSFVWIIIFIALWTAQWPMADRPFQLRVYTYGIRGMLILRIEDDNCMQTSYPAAKLLCLSQVWPPDMTSLPISKIAFVAPFTEKVYLVCLRLPVSISCAQAEW